MNRVSVIIPTWNREKTLARAIDSALTQSFPVHEVLICDDGSSDDSKRLVEDFKKKDKRVKWIDGERAGRPAVPRNRGIKNATGNWIAFLDSDDEWLPNKLQEQMKFIEQHKVNACCSNANIIKQGSVTGFFSDYSKDLIELTDLVQSNYIICSSVIVRKDIVEKVNGFPEEESLKALEDYALWLRVATQGSFGYVNKLLVNYKDEVSESIRGNQSETNAIIQRAKVFENFLNWVEKSNVKFKNNLRKEIESKIEQSEDEGDVPVSVILPVYNGGKYVKEAIDSILNQTYPHFELILINDGSTDNSDEIISAYKDARINYIKQENQGFVNSLNRALSIAKGKFIARMDADDISYPQRFEKQLSFLKNNIDYAFVGSWATIFPSDEPRFHKHPTENALLKFDLLFDNPFVHSSVMMRRRHLDSIGGRYVYDKGLWEDYTLWSMFAKKYKIANLGEVLQEYREVSTGMSQTTRDYKKMVVRQSAENLAFRLNKPSSDPEVIEIAELIHGIKSCSSPLKFYKVAKALFSIADSLIETEDDKRIVYNRVIEKLHCIPLNFPKNILAKFSYTLSQWLEKAMKKVLWFAILKLMKK